MDHSRRFGDVTFDGAPARRVAGVDVLPQVRRRALALLSCEAVGIGQRALETAAEHAKSREAFSRPIGTFQAISHQVADMFTAVQLARSLAYWAAWAVDADDERADLACAAAKSAAAEAAVMACEHAIQVMGGVGFTWEHFLHRFYKRAQWIEAFEGYGAAHRADIAAAIIDDPAPV
jgi:alkylation response protein AidB-like acyl-CoA dehydrogenase